MSVKPITAISNALKVFVKGFSAVGNMAVLPNVKTNVHVTFAKTEAEKKEAFHLVKMV